MIRSAVAACALAAVLAFGLWAFSGRWHPSDTTYPLQGIDVSHHQGAIDWGKLPAQGVDFAYIKATEGGELRDERFDENWDGAVKAGIRPGAYHFFTLCRSGAGQAENFVGAVPAMPDALPPAVDLEFGGNCAARPDRSSLLRELKAFLDRIEAHSGRRAILYLTSEFDNHYRVSRAIERDLWLRKLVFEPRFGARPWVVWQASNFRRLDGIAGRVDWNAARLDLAVPGPSFGRPANQALEARP